MIGEFTGTQKRALAVFTVIAIAFGAYFLRGYFILVVIAAVGAHLFTPLFIRLNKRFGTGLSATLTVLAALLAVAIPAALFVLLAVVQITNMVESVAQWLGNTDLTSLGDRLLRGVNEVLARVPLLDITVTQDSLRGWMTTFAQHAGQWGLGFLKTAAGSAIGAITSAIIFVYVFVALLVNRDKVITLIRQLNPLGEDVTDLYLAKMGAMVRGTVTGQFVIASVQGVTGAASIYIAGFHDGFFIFAILLTALSIIPLGSGIVTIPFGVGMALFGNIAGGAFVVLWHLIAVTNIDNFLRPILVPREARLNPALMLLAVFSGIAMFGFWGIVIGPVLMIVIVTTLSVYLAVFEDVPLDLPEEETPEPKRRFRRFTRKRATERELVAEKPPESGA
ncbi:MAG: AI-2E family transporter [Mycobacterium sp.]